MFNLTSSTCRLEDELKRLEVYAEEQKEVKMLVKQA